MAAVSAGNLAIPLIRALTAEVAKDNEEAAGVPSSASELVHGQVAEVIDGQ